MSIYEQLALLYVEKNAKEGETPEKLLQMFRVAHEQIAKCDKIHNGKAFSL